MSMKINRRGFIRQAVGASALAWTARRAIAQTPASITARPARLGANEEIRTAVIGIRGQGQHHLSYHQACPNVRIITLCDPDENLFGDRLKLVKGGTPKTETDLRRVFDDKAVDCVSIAMPNFWHALATVWACQAGKDVYVEKPATYCISEGPKMIAATRKYGRVVQVGTQIRARKGRQEAVRLLRDGIIGRIYMARGFVFNPRGSIGHQADAPVPAGVHYDLWCGPASMKPFNPNRFHYNWHWYWDYGNGETGNNGPHVTDLAIDGLDKQGTHPVKVFSDGGRFVWDDQGETPNTQITSYQYADGTVLALDVRNLASHSEVGTKEAVIFYGAKGYMILRLDGDYETVINGEPGPKGSGQGGAHTELAANFYEVVRSRKYTDLLAPPEYGHTGAALCHLGNIAYRLGRSVEFDPKTESFGRDSQANALLTREYRKPFVMPEQV